MYCGYALKHAGIENVQTTSPRRLQSLRLLTDGCDGTEDHFNIMTVSQLKQYLSEREIVVSNALKKLFSCPLPCSIFVKSATKGYTARIH